MDHRRDDRRVGRDGEDEWAFLEWTKLIFMAPGAFWVDHDRAAALHFRGGRFIGLECLFPVFPIDKDDAGALNRPSENRNLLEFRLCHEAAPRNFRRECENIEPTHM